MADLSDVEQALATAIWTALYPAGANTSPANGYETKVFPGWPTPADVEADCLEVPPVVNVSVFCQPGMERNTTRYPQAWRDQYRTTPTLTATVSGSTVTLGGTITAGHYLSIVVFNRAFSYACQPSDTLASVAAAMAALINAAMPAYASGDAFTIIGRTDIAARVAAPGTQIQELGRSNQRFLITIWAPTNAVRVATAKVIRPALEAINFLSLADTSFGRLIYECSNDLDRYETKTLSCRDLYFWVEYPTTLVEPGYPITIPQAQITATVDGSDQPPYVQNS